MVIFGGRKVILKLVNFLLFFFYLNFLRRPFVDYEVKPKEGENVSHVVYYAVTPVASGVIISSFGHHDIGLQIIICMQCEKYKDINYPVKISHRHHKAGPDFN